MTTPTLDAATVADWVEYETANRRANADYAGIHDDGGAAFPCIHKGCDRRLSTKWRWLHESKCPHRPDDDTT